MPSQPIGQQPDASGRTQLIEHVGLIWRQSGGGDDFLLLEIAERFGFRREEIIAPGNQQLAGLFALTEIRAVFKSFLGGLNIRYGGRYQFGFLSEAGVKVCR
jgi:hypothetical protein